MPALPSSIIAPSWDQVAALLPERTMDHPLGCHRPRLPDRLIFDKLVQVRVFGCAYWRIADATGSATTRRRRRDAWIALGILDRLSVLVLDASDRMIGLELDALAVDGGITKAPCGGEVAGRSPVDRGKQGLNRATVVDANGIPLGAIAAPANRPDSPLLEPTLTARGPLPGAASVHLDRGYDSDRTRAAGGTGARGRDRSQGPTRPHRRLPTLAGRAHHRLDQRPQAARLVHRAAGTGDRVLAGVRGGEHGRPAARARGLDPVPVGDPPRSQAMSVLPIGASS